MIIQADKDFVLLKQRYILNMISLPWKSIKTGSYEQINVLIFLTLHIKGECSFYPVKMWSVLYRCTLTRLVIQALYWSNRRLASPHIYHQKVRWSQNSSVKLSQNAELYSKSFIFNVACALNEIERSLICEHYCKMYSQHALKSISSLNRYFSFLFHAFFYTGLAHKYCNWLFTILSLVTP